jgi:outer membrane protein assembly factor BamB
VPPVLKFRRAERLDPGCLLSTLSFRLHSRAGLVALLTLALVLGSAVPALADYSETPARAWSVNGRVNAIVRVGSRVFIGGSFSQLRSPTGETVARRNLAALDAASGAPVTSWAPSADGVVYALAASPDGARVFAGGAFTTVNGQARRRLAALSTSSGAVVDGWVAQASATVRGMTVLGSRLYVGGQFNKIGSATRVRLAALDVGTGQLQSWSPSASATVKSLEPTSDGTRIVIAGDFRTVNGTSRDYLASVDAGSGALNGWTPAAACIRDKNPCVLIDVAVDGSTVYVAVAGPGGQVIAYDAGTGSRRWRIRADGDVQAVAVRDGTLYAGGHFYQRFGNNPDGSFIVRKRLAAADARTGVVDQNFKPDVAGNLGVWVIAPDADALRIGGDFTSVNRVKQERYAQLPSR